MGFLRGAAIANSLVSDLPWNGENNILKLGQVTLYYPYSNGDPTTPPDEANHFPELDSGLWGHKRNWIATVRKEDVAAGWATGETVRVWGRRPSGLDLVLALSMNQEGEVEAEGPFNYLKFTCTGAVAATRIYLAITAYNEGDRHS